MLKVLGGAHTEEGVNAQGTRVSTVADPSRRAFLEALTKGFAGALAATALVGLPGCKSGAGEDDNGNNLKWGLDGLDQNDLNRACTRSVTLKSVEGGKGVFVDEGDDPVRISASRKDAKVLGTQYWALKDEKATFVAHAKPGINAGESLQFDRVIRVPYDIRDTEAGCPTTPKYGAIEFAGRMLQITREMVTSEEKHMVVTIENLRFRCPLPWSSFNANDFNTRQVTIPLIFEGFIQNTYDKKVPDEKPELPSKDQRLQGYLDSFDANKPRVEHIELPYWFKSDKAGELDKFLRAALAESKQDGGKLVVIDKGAEDCPPCRMMAPIFDAAGKYFNEDEKNVGVVLRGMQFESFQSGDAVKFLKLVSKQLSIDSNDIVLNSFPSFIYLYNGEVVKHSGARDFVPPNIANIPREKRNLPILKQLIAVVKGLKQRQR